MRRAPERMIYTRCPAQYFTGRSIELDTITAHARSGAGGMALLARPMAGASELLRQAHERLFYEQSITIPIYFEFRRRDRTLTIAARRFLREVIRQAAAFRLGDPRVLSPAVPLNEAAGAGAEHGAAPTARLMDLYGSLDEEDENDAVQRCLAAPLRLAAEGLRPAVLLDAVHAGESLDGGEALIEHLVELYGHSEVPIVAAGRRRYLFGRTPFAAIPLEELNFAAAGQLAVRLSERTGVLLNDQTRDLLAVQLGGRPRPIGLLFAAAASRGVHLDTFERVQQVYNDEIFSGRLERCYEPGAPSLDDTVVRLLAEAYALAPGHKMPLERWTNALGGRAAVDDLHHREIVNAGAGAVAAERDDHILRDVVAARISLRGGANARAAAVGRQLTDSIARAPELMERYYRSLSSAGLRELMLAFDGQRVSPALLDYGRFRDQLKGAPRDKVLKALREDNETLELPRIAFTAHTSAFYPPLASIADPERSAVAMGFAGDAGSERTVWIAAEVPSKLEAARDLASFWCDRLEMAAVNSGLTGARLWLISPEGFSPEALELLRQRNALGSSSAQLKLLAEVLHLSDEAERPLAADEYEIVVPMGEDTEMIAAYAVQEIARRHNFPAKAINQIKTALVEACINAAEHSMSPDRRIHQKFAVADDKITITVANRGLRLAARQDAAPEPAVPPGDPGRRGWGLKLIKGLMDDVQLEQTDDGTRLTMTKYIKSA